MSREHSVMLSIDMANKTNDLEASFLTILTDTTLPLVHACGVTKAH